MTVSGQPRYRPHPDRAHLQLPREAGLGLSASASFNLGFIRSHGHDRFHSSLSPGLDPNRALLCSYLEKRVGWVLTHLWNLMTEDVEHTLRNVTKLLFDREEGGKSHTKSLSQALLIIGEEFGVRLPTASWLVGVTLGVELCSGPALETASQSIVQPLIASHSCSASEGSSEEQLEGMWWQRAHSHHVSILLCLHDGTVAVGFPALAGQGPSKGLLIMGKVLLARRAGSTKSVPCTVAA